MNLEKSLKILHDGKSMEYVYKMSGVDISKIKELKANL